jgi:hypothetical protein
MSAPRHRFDELLRRLAARLDLPQPAKSRALLEIAGDLEDACEHYRRSGLDEEAAREAAVERFDLSEAALRDLAAVHATRLRRLLDGLSARGRDRLERVALSLVLLFVVALAWVRLSGAGLLDHVGPEALPAFAVTIGALAIATRKAWSLWLTREHDLRSLRRGLPEVLIAGVAGLVFGTVGFWVALYRIAGEFYLQADPLSGTAGGLFVSGLRRAFATGNAAIFCALLCGLLWWALEQRVASIERAETEYLMEI